MAESELEDRLHEFQRVIEARDVEAAGEVLDEEYVLVVSRPSLVVVPRASWLAMLPDYMVHEWTVQEQHIDVDGDCAAVLHQGFQRATVLGDSRDGVFVVTDVWRRRAGLWRVWRRHSTPLDAGPMPGDAGTRSTS